MNITLQQSALAKHTEIQITGSKSESNRLLILQALQGDMLINNLSNSDDTRVMKQALSSDEVCIDIHHAGTAMRFLTAYFAMKEDRTVTLTGSSRMKERPIKLLVDALEQLGASIAYEGAIGYPPLKITGKKFEKNHVTLAANVSSQYISALLLIGPYLKNGLLLSLEGTISSVPYIKMTLALLDQLGIKTEFKGQTIQVFPIDEIKKTTALTVESDWSSASYFYSLIALSPVGTSLSLSAYKQHSLQGDSCLATIYAENFGVHTAFKKNTITLTKQEEPGKSDVVLDLLAAPDIAQTIAVTSFGLGYPCTLTGLHTLKIKETDRLVALKNELEKLGAYVLITEDSLKLKKADQVRENKSIATYQDHRMAMAFAPLALKTTLQIMDAEVVSKSFPDFWTDLEKLGIMINY